VDQLLFPKELNVGEVSDGYHTFNELYLHRHSLMLVLMKAHPDLSWFSPKHDDGAMMDGWFIAGIRTPFGIISYHLPVGFLHLAELTGAKQLDQAPEWDGHTSSDVLARLQGWVSKS
jgi:hypothetical protein